MPDDFNLILAYLKSSDSLRSAITFNVSCSIILSTQHWLVLLFLNSSGIDDYQLVALIWTSPLRVARRQLKRCYAYVEPRKKMDAVVPDPKSTEYEHSSSTLHGAFKFVMCYVFLSAHEEVNSILAFIILPVVLPTIPVFWSTASRNWPITSGTLWIRLTSSWAWRYSFFKFLCSSLMYDSWTSRNSSCRWSFYI